MDNNPERRSCEDQGQTIADMNVEGMPWYSPVSKEEGDGRREQLSDEGRRAFALGTMTAGLLVTVVFAVAFLAFILLLTKI